jgi:phosphoribosylformimino-5-aminoimidazole carboxamide ribotide isomerase
MNSRRFLLVIPSIDIKDGKTVRVVQGIPELNCSEYGDDPVEMAKLWRAENAKMIHIVDFDGAFEHSNRNLKIVEKICTSVVIPVEFAGGIRNLDDAKAVFETGVARVAISTLVFENRSEFEKIFNLYGPTRVVVCFDIVDQELIIRGKKKKTGLNYINFASEVSKIGVERFIITDVNRNGLMKGPNIEYSLNVAKLTNCKVTHSGGVRNKDELMDLQQYLVKGIDSVIVGRALYENIFPCQKLWRVAESGIFN